MAEDPSSAHPPQKADEGVDKKAVLDEIQSKIETPAPPPQVSSVSEAVAGRSKQTESDEPVVIPVKSSASSDTGDEGGGASLSTPIGFWGHIVLHRDTVSFCICVSIGLVWGIIGLATHKTVALVLAAVFLVPNVLWYVSSFFRRS